MEGTIMGIMETIQVGLISGVIAWLMLDIFDKIDR
jgi:hypothetical protein